MARPLPIDSTVAILIDADNTPHNQMKQIIDESARYGRPIIKRAYGDWSKPNLGKWLDVCNENAIKSIQLNRYVSHKNTTDLGMFVDAMDMLHRKEVNTFVLVSSDSDFTSLAIRMKEGGFQVVGIGEKKTPLSFTKACDQFVYLESEETMTDSKKFTKEQIQAQLTSRELLIRALKQTMDESGIVNGSFLAEMLRRIEPSFDHRKCGVRKFSDFLTLYSDVIKTTGEKSGLDPIYQVNDKALKSDSG